MSLHEKTVYPQLVAAFAADELERYFTPTAEELEFANKGARSNGSRLTLLTLLKLFQVLHRFPAPSEVPAAIVQHIRIHLGIGDDVMLENNDAVQRSRQYAAIREYTSVRRWDKEARHLAVAAGYAAALVMARPADIVNATIGALIHARYELPVFATLERILHRVHALAHRNTTKSMFRRLRSKDRKELDQLLVIAVDQRRTTFEAIKKAPRRPSRKHLEDSVRHLEWLETLGGDGAALTGVASTLVGDFAKQARTTDAAELKRFTAPKRYTLLLSLIHHTRAQTRDAVARMLVNRVATVHRRAQDELEQRQFEQRERVDGLLGKFGEVIHIVATVRSDRLVGQQVRGALTNTQEIGVLQQEWASAQTCAMACSRSTTWRTRSLATLALLRPLPR